MFSKIASLLRRTSAWRFSVMSTVAFAFGTAIAFSIVYKVMGDGIRERSDAWLVGEGELLAQVAANTPAGEMRERLVEEIAELARHEVLPMPGTPRTTEYPVFFLTLNVDGEPGVWVGPGERKQFIDAIHNRRHDGGKPWSLPVPGWDEPFRVMAYPFADGSTGFLGFVDQSALALLHRVAMTFVWLWVVMLFFGLAISYLAARRILGRVEEITETAATVGSEALDRRMAPGSGDDEISRLARTFNAMLDRVQESVEQVQTMADAVTHDLRSPLTSIRGNLELAVTHDEREQLQEAAASAIEGLDQLLRTLTTSLDVAEAGAGALRLNRQTVDLNRMILETVEVYRPAAEEHGLTLETSGEGVVDAVVDPDLTRRALANLLDNAIEHLPPGCHVRVSVEANGRATFLSVADDGPGFPPEVRARAFERGTKGPSSTGFGIGLALVRSVARAHGGDAEVLDPPGGGAMLRLSFPRRPGSAGS